MKKLLMTAAAVFAFGFANAQDNAIKVNPLSLFGGNDLVSFEHKIGETGSAALGVGYSSLSIGSLTYTNMGAEVQYRFYFGDEALHGWYAGPNVGFTSGKLKNEGTTYSYTSNGVKEESSSDVIKYTRLQIGARGGYQWCWDSGFTLDLNAGFAYNNIKYASDTLGLGVTASGILPNFGLGLGYAF